MVKSLPCSFLHHCGILTSSRFCGSRSQSGAQSLLLCSVAQVRSGGQLLLRRQENRCHLYTKGTTKQRIWIWGSLGPWNHGQAHYRKKALPEISLLCIPSGFPRPMPALSCRSHWNKQRLPFSGSLVRGRRCQCWEMKTGWEVITMSDKMCPPQF